VLLVETTRAFLIDLGEIKVAANRKNLQNNYYIGFDLDFDFDFDFDLDLELFRKGIGFLSHITY
jgi:hypothetical protein